MARFFHFLQAGGLRGCVFHFAVGFVVAALTTALGIIADRGQLLGGYAGKLLLWPSYSLWLLLRSSFIERYDDGLPVYAGLPFMFTWFLGILLAIPIYATVSAAIGYLCYKPNERE